jgi:hypothetical protein
MSGKAGLDKVLSQERPAVQASLEAQPEQLAMLPEAEKRGPGKPAGARNRRTDEMVRYLNTFGQGPLVGLAKVVNAIRFHDQGELAGMPDFTELARALGMKRSDAAAFWRSCAVDLAPYMHQKLPVAIDVTGDSSGSLVVVNLGAVQGDPETDLGDLLGGHIGDVVDHEPSEENQ